MKNSQKEIVDNYLLEHFEEINTSRLTEKDFRWDVVAAKIKGNYLGGEYVRNRFSKLRKKYKNIVIDSIAKSDIEHGEVLNKSVSKEKIDNLNSTISSKFNYQSGKENKQTGSKEWTFTASTIPTEQEIVDHFNIDTKKWKIVNIYHKTSFGGSYSITVQTNLLKGSESVDYIKEFESFIEKYNINKLKPSVIQKQTDKFQIKTSVLLNLSDLHVGKLAWDKEVGADYNVDLAKEVFLTALKNLVYQSIRCFGVEEFVLNIGGDFFHTNGSLNQTANGTNMNDVDTRYQKIYIKGLEILTEAIDFLSSFEGVSVKLYVVQGNHDKATSFYLGESLKAFYRKDKNIEIVNDPHIRKYHKYGVTSYMLTHGDCKDDGLPLTFATEKPDYFANSEYRYIFLGHLHKSSRKVYLTENEVGGVVSRRLNSLSVMDAWHNENNYYGAKRMANALVFDKDNGQIAEFNYIVKR